MPENNFNKVSTLWTCQTYMENMSTVLKPGEISFGVLFFRQILRQLRMFFRLLPLNKIAQVASVCLLLCLRSSFGSQMRYDMI